MKLSTKGRYGLRAMIDIGVHSKEVPLSLRSISKRLDISESYLEQLISKLKKESLVISKRGAKGGYILGRNAAEITVGEILRALEGSLGPTVCTCEDHGCTNCCGDTESKCVTKSVWIKIKDGINNVVDNIYLSELIEDFKKTGNANQIKVLM
ncbi:RrF2 family transcriptional regulator [Candidatus Epulonipiscium viviparus]|uniref:RrF2 family transcriptional regulator n=1 Tax=Candidatus Epulonipiscium viviparus TaxID=420336 RepID=UPI0027380BEA|nr:Rrf2 family transcriptional regulator [Candidatus Epulopiscium viviparus]